MFIKDKPIRIVQWLMIGVEKYLMRKFSKISFLDIPQIDKDRATLVIMNHFSFNDGPMMHHLCRKVLRKQFKVMVLEEQVVSFKPLRYAGCFSVNKKSKSVVESLDYAASLLADPKNMLGIFPQGGVYSLHLNHIHFEQGLARILKKNKQPIQVVFAVLLLDYLNDFKPKANIYMLDYTGAREVGEMEVAYNEFYRKCKTRQRMLFGPPAEVVD